MSDHSPDPAARPTPRIPRVSIGQMMAVVAACAAISGGVLEALAKVLILGVFLTPIAWFTAVVGKGLGEARITVFAFAAGAAVILGSTLVGQPHDPEKFVVVALTTFNGMGLFVIADRRLHRRPLTSDHLLWAWAGLVWPASLLPVHRGGSAEVLSGCARLLLALVMLLIAFARRSVDGEDTRTRWAGWAVVECDVLAWGWFTVRSSGWI